MGRSKGTIISVKVPVCWHMMTEKQKTRLNRITGRDTRVIQAYLGVIEHHEADLLMGHRQKKINASCLDKMTLTASKGIANRQHVLHDFKVRFPNISVNEFQECRDTAIALWQSYLELGGSKPLSSKNYSKRKLPRFAFSRRFQLVNTPELSIKHWLKLIDSLDSNTQGRTRHDTVMIPLSISSFHLNQMDRGEVKTVRILKDTQRKWWTIFTVTLEVSPLDVVEKPPAVLSIDLGINKAASSVLLTQKGYKQVQYWKQEDKSRRMKTLDNRIESLQRKKEQLFASGMNLDGVCGKLRELSGKRARLSNEYDRKLVRHIIDHIMDLALQYNLYVSIGRLRGIRNKARRGNLKGSAFRGMIHRWSFSRICDMLEHKLAIQGLDTKFKAVPESWTSIMCHKCGHKGLRPKQNLFICHTCGYRANADLNGAINIGKRLIMLIPSLRDEKGLGMWLNPKDKATLKAWRKNTSSQGKSSLSQRIPASKGEFVADCYDQTSLVGLASSKDPAMVNAVEKPTVIMLPGEHESTQRNEAGSHQRNDIPMKKGKACDTLKDANLLNAGDSSRKKGETEKFLMVHSHYKK